MLRVFTILMTTHNTFAFLSYYLIKSHNDIAEYNKSIHTDQQSYRKKKLTNEIFFFFPSYDKLIFRFEKSKYVSIRIFKIQKSSEKF